MIDVMRGFTIEPGPPGDTVTTKPGLPPQTLLPIGREPTSNAFFNAVEQNDYTLE